MGVAISDTSILRGLLQIVVENVVQKNRRIKEKTRMNVYILEEKLRCYK